MVTTRRQKQHTEHKEKSRTVVNARSQEIKRKSKIQKQKMTCSICLSDVRSGGGIITCKTEAFTEGHCFHRKCLTKWFISTGHTNCPTCRQEVNKYPEAIILDPFRSDILKGKKKNVVFPRNFT